MDKILVLGDCASNGNNALGHLVYNDDNVVMTYSLIYHQKFDEVVKWFFTSKKNGDIVYDGPAINNSNIHHIAMAELVKKEKEISWPEKLQKDTVNLSINGNHFGYYLVQLKRYLSNNSKPAHVLITDYSSDHIFLHFIRDGVRYDILPSYSLLDKPYEHGKKSYPENLHETVVDKFKTERKKSSKYLMKKNKRMFKVLKNFCNKNDIEYTCVLFRNEFRDIFLNEDVIDLVDIKNQWSNGIGDNSGEVCKKKFELQEQCAEIVDLHIKHKQQEKALRLKEMRKTRLNKKYRQDYE